MWASPDSDREVFGFEEPVCSWHSQNTPLPTPTINCLAVVVTRVIIPAADDLIQSLRSYGHLKSPMARVQAGAEEVSASVQLASSF